MGAASDNDCRNERRENLRRTLQGESCPAILVSSEANVRYLTGFTGEASTLILTSTRAIMVSDGRFQIQLLEECPQLEHHIRPIGQPMWKGLASLVEKLELTSIAFESEHVTVADLERFQFKAPSVNTQGVNGWVEDLRSIKDEEEVHAIRDAIQTAEQAFQNVVTSSSSSMSEKELADDIDLQMRRMGASGSSFPTIVAAGANAARPHARPSAETRLETSDFVLVDWGANRQGYKSDLTRVLVTGNFTAKFESVYLTVLAAQTRAINAIRPGAKASEVDAEARSVIEEAGFGDYFTHSVGHGIGLEIHEAPWLRSTSEGCLRAGMVVTVEPGIYLPDWGGIRIEDDVLVTPEGHEILTRLPKDLDSILEFCGKAK